MFEKLLCLALDAIELVFMFMLTVGLLFGSCLKEVSCVKSATAIEAERP